MDEIIIFQDEDRIIYWDKKRKGFWYRELNDPDYDYEICMFRPGNLDLDNDEVAAIYQFIEEHL